MQTQSVLFLFREQGLRIDSLFARRITDASLRLSLRAYQMRWTSVGQLVSSLVVLHTKKGEDEEHSGKLIFTPGVCVGDSASFCCTRD